MRRSLLVASLLALSLAFAITVARAKRGASCPVEMARVPGRAACIDRFEAALPTGALGDRDGKGTTARAVAERGLVPAMRVSQRQARAACRNAGKRLCTVEEWSAACRGGDAGRAYPYGAKYEPARCADRALLEQRHAKGPLPTGSLPACATPDGVYDLSGNVTEWLDDGTRRTDAAPFLGGNYLRADEEDAQSCRPEEPTFQPQTMQLEALGFRCCKDGG